MATVPLHTRLAETLRAQILSGEPPVGSQLSSEARLGAQYDASRGTVRAALAALRHDGLIEGGQGRPSTVRNNAPAQPFETFMSFTTWALQIGRTPGQQTIEVARRGADAAAAVALDLPLGTRVVEVLRLRTLDGLPAMLERASFPEHVGRLLFDFDPDTSSIYAHLTAHGVQLDQARHTIDAVAASDVDADHLEVPLGAPLLRERRRTTSTRGEPLEYGDDRYRPDRVTFSIDNVQPAASGTAPDLRIIKETS